MFHNALPDLDKAQIAFYADVDRLSQLDDPSAAPSGIRAVGFTATSPAGGASLHLRIVVG